MEREARVILPIRTRSNAQKTHIYGIKAAYNMSVKTVRSLTLLCIKII